MRKKLLTIIAIILPFVTYFVGFLNGVSKDMQSDVDTPEIAEVNPQLNRVFREVWKVTNEKFVDVEKLDPDNMFYGAMKGVVKSLGDPHSEFLTPEESEEFLDSLEGDLTGIGAEVGMRDDVLTVISPLRESPAEKAGLLPGDKIFKIDGEIASDYSLFDAVKKIRGLPGTDVTLTIFRGEEIQPREITITRDYIDVKSVNSELRDDGIAVVTVSTFADDTADEFKEALSELAIKNPKGMILDLRFNGGGFLDAAIEMTSKLMESGEVVQIHERGKSDEVISATGAPLLPKIPLVVLINEGSASASEIMAGSLQDNSRATIIGEKSFGKGTVQELISDFEDGSTLRITVAKWFTPSGRDINEEGIHPDFEVPLDPQAYLSEGEDTQLEAAVEFLQTGKVSNAKVEETSGEG